MPTRPLSTEMNLRATGAGALAHSEGTEGEQPVRVDFAVEQRRADRHASGHFRLEDAARGFQVNVESDELGMLQGTGLWGARWATFTGTVRSGASGEAKPLLVVIEGNASSNAEAQPTVTIQIGEDYQVSGPMDTQVML
jgi:hypothetical protein